MKHFFILVILNFSSTVFAQDFSIYKKEKEFGKLKLTVADLKKVVENIKYYKDEYPVDTADKYNYFTVSCEIKKDDESQTFQGFEHISKIQLDQKVYSGLTLDYNFSRQAISTVDLTLVGSYRKLSVSGKDRIKVDALFRALDDEISDHESVLNIIDWEPILVSIIVMLLIGSLMFLTGAKLNNPSPEAMSMFNKIKLICGIYILLCVIFFITPLKIRDLFPGFQLMSENVNWWDKYGNLISVAALFTSLLIAAFNYVRKLLKLVPFSSAPVNSDAHSAEAQVITASENHNEVQNP